MSNKEKNKKEKDAQVPIQFYVRLKERENIQEFCDDNGETVSNFIRTCIDFFISRDTTPSRYIAPYTRDKAEIGEMKVDITPLLEELKKGEDRDLNILNALEGLRREINTASIRTSTSLSQTLSMALERLEKIQKGD